MIIVWGKIIGLGLGAFGGITGAAFGLLVGHLLDVVAAQWLLRRALQRVLEPGAIPGQRQVTPLRVLTALTIGLVSAPDWRPGALERTLFAERTTTAGYSGLRAGRIPSLLRIARTVLAREHSRCLDAALSLKADMTADGLASRTRELLEQQERRTLVEICCAVLDLDPRASVRRKLREFAIGLELPAEWIDLVLPAQEGPEPATVDDDAWAILGVSQDADLVHVKRTYRRLAAQFHPDTAAGLSAEQQEQTAAAFVKIRNAYEKIVAGLEK